MSSSLGISRIHGHAVWAFQVFGAVWASQVLDVYQNKHFKCFKQIGHLKCWMSSRMDISSVGGKADWAFQALDV